MGSNDGVRRGRRTKGVIPEFGNDGPRRGVVWSADGRRIYFIVGTNDAPAYPPIRDIYSVPDDGGQPQRLVIGLHDLYFLNVHPNGRQLIFADEQWKNGL